MLAIDVLGYLLGGMAVATQLVFLLGALFVASGCMHATRVSIAPTVNEHGDIGVDARLSVTLGMVTGTSRGGLGGRAFAGGGSGSVGGANEPEFDWGFGLEGILLPPGRFGFRGGVAAVGRRFFAPGDPHFVGFQLDGGAELVLKRRGREFRLANQERAWMLGLGFEAAMLWHESTSLAVFGFPITFTHFYGAG